MKQGTGLAIAVTVAALAAGAGYWLGTRHDGSGHVAAPAVQQPVAADGKKERKLLYYRNPMGLPDTSPTPKKDPRQWASGAAYSPLPL